MAQHNLISISNSEASWFAISLAIPSYFITLIGTAPVLQGCFYLIYLLGIFFIWQRRQQDRYSLFFMISTLIFFLVWIIPNVVTLNSGRLESEMLSLPILIYHAVIFFVVILWARSWSMDQKNFQNSFQQCCQTLLILLTPLVTLIVLETLRLTFEFPDRRPDPFNYRHLNGEIILMFCLAGLAMNNKGLKLVVLLVTISSLSLMENRGGLLSVGIIIGFMLTIKILNKLNAKQILYFLGVISLLIFLFYEQAYKFIDYFFLLEHKSRGLGTGVTHRLPVWMETWQEIQRVPWTGVGFWVSPYPYGEFGYQGQGAVHNIFLRLWVENGTILLLVVMTILISTVIQIERKKLHWHRMAFWSILAYYFFIPRHLTLNPLSILLYWTIVQALCLPSKKGGNK